MTAPDDVLTLAELDAGQAAPADPERLPEIPAVHPGWGNPRGELWGRIGVAHACLSVLWPHVASADVEEDGPTIRADLARVYEADYGLDLPDAFERASAYRGPRTTVLHARAVGLAAAADAGTAALAGNDDEAVIMALAALHSALDPENNTDTDEEND